MSVINGATITASDGRQYNERDLGHSVRVTEWQNTSSRYNLQGPVTIGDYQRVNPDGDFWLKGIYGHGAIVEFTPAGLEVLALPVIN